MSPRTVAFAILAAVLAPVASLFATAESPSGTGGQEQASQVQRTPSGQPDLNGIWQAVGLDHWNIEASETGVGIVEGGDIPYTAVARAQQQDNLQYRFDRDPAMRCYMPGVPRATYMPYPFQIVQNEDYILLAYEFASANRTVYMNQADFEAPIDSWMGHSVGSWEGDTLVIDVTDQLADTWLDSAGNHHSTSLRVVERYTPNGPNHVMYEATIEDPEVYTRPWTIRLPLYRRIEENMQLLEYNCVEFSEELMYGHLRTNPGLLPDQVSEGNAYPPEVREDHPVRDFIVSFAGRYEMRNVSYISDMFRRDALLVVDSEEMEGAIKIGDYYTTLFADEPRLVFANLRFRSLSDNEWRIVGDYTLAAESMDANSAGSIVAFCVEDGESFRFIRVEFERDVVK